MQPGEPVLLVCHAFPPVAGIGGRRWAKFAKELARRGHTVHVVRCGTRPGRPASLWSEDADTPGIVHHVLPARYPAVLTQVEVASLADKLRYHAWMKVLPWLCKGNWYDPTIFWRKQLRRKAKELVHRHGIRQVIATGAPFRLMAYAAELKLDLPHLHLVVDLRDEWTWKDHYGLASIGAGRRQREMAMEARVMQLADQVTTPHARIVEHLQRTYPGDPAKYKVLPHAVDPADFDAATFPAEDGIFRMVYAGSLYGAGEADVYFEQLLGAFEALRTNRPGAFACCRLDLYITGHDVGAYRTKVAARGLAEQVRFHPPVPPKEVFRLIKASNVVILYIPQVNKDILGTKFQEIFYAGTPILHVGEPGVVSRTIREKRMGDTVRVEELVQELPRILSGERQVRCDRHADHSAYLLPSVTDKLLREVLV
ncbi:MAG: glycosyltransferase [Flavobacteriales bacterium]|nr:glycosyltransferase [Flavobacteriales bacterium]MBP9079281.1 glycosyltransferase [Flavobacteriales bacterium]